MSLKGSSAKAIFMFRIFIVTLVTSFFTLNSIAQMAVGEWREHFPYSKVIDLEIGNGTAFCATPFAIFQYHEADNSIERLSKINELSATGISCISYQEEARLLLVGYETGNLDFIYDDVSFNIGDIERSDIIGDKSIYSIVFKDQFAYLACGFGIVQIDLERREVKDTFIIGPNGTQIAVYDIAIQNGVFYAGTQSGLYSADANNSFLANFASWSLDLSVPTSTGPISMIEVNENIIVINKEGGNADDTILYSELGSNSWQALENWENLTVNDIKLTPNYLYCAGYNRIDKFDTNANLIENLWTVNGDVYFPLTMNEGSNGSLWIGDSKKGLLKMQSANTAEVITPKGPPFFNVRRIDAYNNTIWLASGGVSQSWVNNYDKNGFYGLVNDSWVYTESPSGENEVVQVNDILDVSINPLNNNQVFFSSWEEGIVEMNNGIVTNIYNENNSTLEHSTVHPDERYMTSSCDFDVNGNLWITSSYTDHQLHVRKANGQFRSFSFSPELGNTEVIGEVMATRQGQIWIVLPNREAVLVFDYNGTIDNTADDRFKLLTSEEGAGGIPNVVYSIEEDLDGEIWIGTLEGVAVFYTPLSIFSDTNFDAQQILIEQGGNIQILLETEAVTAIEIDGGNRKWIGTANSGVFLVSDDGLNQLIHLTAQNSALISNTITDIVLNHGIGEVFFSTEKGLVSYKGQATNFDEEISELTIYPNPIRPDFEGDIIIDGLAYQTDVKITDISGNLVTTTQSNGGRAIWNGKNQDGQRVSTGIYLVFATKLDGSATNVGKIAFIR